VVEGIVRATIDADGSVVALKTVTVHREIDERIVIALINSERWRSELGVVVEQGQAPECIAAPRNVDAGATHA
jgi:hypothetical protein